MRRPLGIVLLVLVAAGLVFAITLVSGEGASSTADAEDDVAFEDLRGRPDDEGLTDILDARVSRIGDEIELRARMSEAVPKKLKRGGLEWRWEIRERGKLTWILTATVALKPHASLIATQTEVTQSTVDGTLPGRVVVSGDLFAVRLKPARLRGFPSEFRWRLTASLDANRLDPGTALAYDYAPDIGSEGFPPE